MLHSAGYPAIVTQQHKPWPPCRISWTISFMLKQAVNFTSIFLELHLDISCNLMRLWWTHIWTHVQTQGESNVGQIQYSKVHVCNTPDIKLTFECQNSPTAMQPMFLMKLALTSACLFRWFTIVGKHSVLLFYFVQLDADLGCITHA